MEYITASCLSESLEEHLYWEFLLQTELEQFFIGVVAKESIFAAIIAIAVVIRVWDFMVVGHYFDSVVQRPYSLVDLNLNRSTAPPGLATPGFIAFICWLLFVLNVFFIVVPPVYFKFNYTIGFS